MHFVFQLLGAKAKQGFVDYVTPLPWGFEELGEHYPTIPRYIIKLQTSILATKKSYLQSMISHSNCYTFAQQYICLAFNGLILCEALAQDLNLSHIDKMNINFCVGQHLFYSLTYHILSQDLTFNISINVMTC